VFLKNEQTLRALKPVVSDVIYDKKSYTDLQIVDVSDDCSPVQGEIRTHDSVAAIL
jgi:hypothetical protein